MKRLICELAAWYIVCCAVYYFIFSWAFGANAFVFFTARIFIFMTVGMWVPISLLWTYATRGEK